MYRKLHREVLINFRVIFKDFLKIEDLHNKLKNDDRLNCPFKMFVFFNFKTVDVAYSITWFLFFYPLPSQFSFLSKNGGQSMKDHVLS